MQRIKAFIEELYHRPKRNTLRWFVTLLASVLLLGFWWNSEPVSTIFLIALLLPLISAFFPTLQRVLYTALTVLTYPVGWLVSFVLLALVYYGILTPIGFLKRIRPSSGWHLPDDQLDESRMYG